MTEIRQSVKGPCRKTTVVEQIEVESVRRRLQTPTLPAAGRVGWSTRRLDVDRLHQMSTVFSMHNTM